MRLFLIMLLLTTYVSATNGNDNDDHKVKICHNGNTISVDYNALDAHLRHGDYLGQCKPTNPPTKPPTNPPTKPPTNPPTKPPTDPPTKPPTDPPTATVPPTKPPSKPTKKPSKPPTKPPTKNLRTNSPTPTNTTCNCDEIKKLKNKIDTLFRDIENCYII